jgi:hypothetical protein
MIIGNIFATTYGFSRMDEMMDMGRVTIVIIWSKPQAKAKMLP